MFVYKNVSVCWSVYPSLLVGWSGAKQKLKWITFFIEFMTIFLFVWLMVWLKVWLVVTLNRVSLNNFRVILFYRNAFADICTFLCNLLTELNHLKTCQFTTYRCHHTTTTNNTILSTSCQNVSFLILFPVSLALGLSQIIL